MRRVLYGLGLALGLSAGGAQAAVVANDQEQTPPPLPTAPPLPSALSTAQQGGVTAVNIGNVMILPPVVHGPQLKRFQETFTQGARTLRELKEDTTDDQIDALCATVNAWLLNTYQWMRSDIGDYAAERFVFRHGVTIVWSLSGEHKPGYVERRSSCIEAMGDWLVNIDNLMRDPTIYPSKPVAPHGE